MGEFKGLVPYFVNFAIVIVLLVFMTRKSLRKYVYQRHERMQDAFTAAAVAHQKAAERASAAKAAMAALANEERALLQREATSADQEKREILDKAQVESQRVARDAERLAGVEQDEASERVKGQFLNLVVQETEASLKRSLKRDDHTAILKRAQNSIEVGF